MFKKLVVLSSIALAACGGGGGGDAPSASNQQSLTFTSLLTAPIKLVTSDSDTSGRSFDIQAAYTGTTDKPLVIVAEDPSGLFDSAYVKNYANGIGTFTLNIFNLGTAKTGTFDSDVKIHACTSVKYVGAVGVNKIATCEGEYSGSPLILKRNIVINALGLDKKQLKFTSSAGESATAQVVTVSGTTDAITATFNPDSGSSTPIDGVKISIVGNQVSLQPTTKLAPGFYKGTLSISSKGFYSQYVAVEFNVGPVIRRGITLDAASLNQLQNLSAPLGSSGTSNWYNLKWTLNSPEAAASYITVSTTPQPNWLRAGTIYANTLSAGLFVDPTVIQVKGTYKATVTLTTKTLGLVDSYDIPVSLTIN